MIQERTL